MRRLMLLLALLLMAAAPGMARAMPAMACCPPAAEAGHQGAHRAGSHRAGPHPGDAGHRHDRVAGDAAGCACPAAAPAAAATIVLPAVPVSSVPVAAARPLPPGRRLAFEPPPPRRAA